MVSRWDKALAALIVSGAVPIIIHFTGWMISADIQAGAVTAITTFFVWLTPNLKGATTP